MVSGLLTKDQTAFDHAMKAPFMTRLYVNEIWAV